MTDAQDVDTALFCWPAADPPAAHLGVVRPGCPRASMTVEPTHLDAVGTAHGRLGATAPARVLRTGRPWGEL